MRVSCRNVGNEETRGRSNNLHAAESSVLRIRQSIGYWKHFPPYTEPEVSLSCSQFAAIDPCTETHKPSPHYTNPFPSNLIFLLLSEPVPQVAFSLEAFSLSFVYEFSVYHTCYMPRPSEITWFNRSIIFAKKYTLLRPSVYNCLYSPFTFSCVNMLTLARSPQTSSMSSRLSLRDEPFNSCKIAGKITVVCIWIFRFTDRRREDKGSQLNRSKLFPNLSALDFFVKSLDRRQSLRKFNKFLISLRNTLYFLLLFQVQ